MRPNSIKSFVKSSKARIIKQTCPISNLYYIIMGESCECNVSRIKNGLKILLLQRREFNTAYQKDVVEL